MTYHAPNTARMNAQQHNHMQRYAGETATVWSYVSAAGGNADVGVGSAIYSAGRTITGHFYVARGFLPNLLQGQTPAGMLAAGDFLMNSDYKPSVNDTVAYQGGTYRVDGQPWHEPFTNTWISNLKRE